MLDVRCLQSAEEGFDVHQFLFRLDWPLFGPAAALNPACGGEAEGEDSNPYGISLGSDSSKIIAG